MLSNSWGSGIFRMEVHRCRYKKFAFRTRLTTHTSSIPYHFDHPLVVTFITFNVHAIFSLYYLSIILYFSSFSYLVSPCILIRLYAKSIFFCPLDAIPHPCSQNVWTLSLSSVAPQTSSEFWLNLNSLLLPAQVASIEVHWNSMSSVSVTPASP